MLDMLVMREYGEAMKVQKKIILPVVAATLLISSGVVLAFQSKPISTKSITPVKTEATTPETSTARPTQEQAQSATTSSVTPAQTEPAPESVTVVSKKVTWEEMTGDVEPGTHFNFSCEITYSDGHVETKILGPEITTLGPDGTPVNKRTCK